MNSFKSLLNLILANLEEAAVFRHLEVQVSALLDRLPLKKKLDLRRLDEVLSLSTLTMERCCLFINDSYPSGLTKKNDLVAWIGHLCSGCGYPEVNNFFEASRKCVYAKWARKYSTYDTTINFYRTIDEVDD